MVFREKDSEPSTRLTRADAKENDITSRRVRCHTPPAFGRGRMAGRRKSKRNVYKTENTESNLDAIPSMFRHAQTLGKTGSSKTKHSPSSPESVDESTTSESSLSLQSRSVSKRTSSLTSVDETINSELSSPRKSKSKSKRNLTTTESVDETKGSERSSSRRSKSKSKSKRATFPPRNDMGTCDDIKDIIIHSPPGRSKPKREISDDSKDSKRKTSRGSKPKRNLGIDAESNNDAIPSMFRHDPVKGKDKKRSKSKSKKSTRKLDTGSSSKGKINRIKSKYHTYKEDPPESPSQHSESLKKSNRKKSKRNVLAFEDPLPSSSRHSTTLPSTWVTKSGRFDPKLSCSKFDDRSNQGIHAAEFHNSIRSNRSFADDSVCTPSSHCSKKKTGSKRRRKKKTPSESSDDACDCEIEDPIERRRFYKTLKKAGIKKIVEIDEDWDNSSACTEMSELSMSNASYILDLAHQKENRKKEREEMALEEALKLYGTWLSEGKKDDKKIFMMILNEVKKEQKENYTEADKRHDALLDAALDEELTSEREDTLIPVLVVAQ